MLHKTRGIVFNTFKYSDNSLIAKIYTEEFGLQSYLVNSVHGKKASTKIAVLQPLTLVDCVVYRKEKKQLQRVKEIKCSHPYVTIPSEISKSSILIFLNEILYKSIKEEEKNEELFEFIHTSLQVLDLKTENCSNFHLLFLMQLTKHLGFLPDGKFSESTSYFDLQSGNFKALEPRHPFYMSPIQSKKFSELLNLSHEKLSLFQISNKERKALLEKIINYFELHLANVQEIKSHKVLEEIF